MMCPSCGSKTWERRIEYNKPWGNQTMRFRHVPAIVCLNIKCARTVFTNETVKLMEEFIVTNIAKEIYEAPSTLFISDDVKKLIKDTTIKTENYVSKKQKNPPPQINLAELGPYWKKKWDSFSGTWSSERQLYRNLYDNFLLFYYSFEQLRKRKYELSHKIVEGGIDGNENLANIAGTHAVGIYLYGKKCIDLLEKLSLISKVGFIKNFARTRNFIFEHNYKPNNQGAITFEPIIWSLASTHHSRLEVKVHTDKEAEYRFTVDYYEDYYLLEEEIVKVIKKF